MKNKLGEIKHDLVSELMLCNHVSVTCGPCTLRARHKGDHKWKYPERKPTEAALKLWERADKL